MSCMDNASIRFSDGKGRGIFADKDFKSGELIMIDRAIYRVKF